MDGVGAELGEAVAVQNPNNQWQAENVCSRDTVGCRSSSPQDITYPTRDIEAEALIESTAVEQIDSNVSFEPTGTRAVDFVPIAPELSSPVAADHINILSPTQLSTQTPVHHYQASPSWKFASATVRNFHAYPSPDDQGVVLNERPTPHSDTAGRIAEPASAQEYEVSLLRYYRYNVAPWLDLGDLDQPFGLQLLHMLSGSEILRQAVLTISAHRQHVSSADTTFRYPFDANYDIPVHETLISPDSIPDLAAHWLQVLTHFVASQPHKWRAIVLNNFHVQGSLREFYVESDLCRAMYWVWLRMGKFGMTLSS